MASALSLSFRRDQLGQFLKNWPKLHVICLPTHRKVHERGISWCCNLVHLLRIDWGGRPNAMWIVSTPWFVVPVPRVNRV